MGSVEGQGRTAGLEEYGVGIQQTSLVQTVCISHMYSMLTQVSTSSRTHII